MTIAFPHRNYRATLGTERLPILIEPTRADGRCAGDPPRAPGRDRAGRDLHRRAARRGHVRPQRRPSNSCRPTSRGWTKTCWVLTARASNLSSGSVSASAWIESRAPWARGSTSRRGSNQAGSHSSNVPTRPEDRAAIRPIRAVLPPTPAYWPGRFGFDAGHSRTDDFWDQTDSTDRMPVEISAPSWLDG
jgi:hypothetical protein